MDERNPSLKPWDFSNFPNELEIIITYLELHDFAFAFALS